MKYLYNDNIAFYLEQLIDKDKEIMIKYKNLLESKYKDRTDPNSLYAFLTSLYTQYMNSNNENLYQEDTKIINSIYESWYTGEVDYDSQIALEKLLSLLNMQDSLNIEGTKDNELALDNGNINLQKNISYPQTHNCIGAFLDKSNFNYYKHTLGESNNQEPTFDSNINLNTDDLVLNLLLHKEYGLRIISNQIKEIEKTIISDKCDLSKVIKEIDALKSQLENLCPSNIEPIKNVNLNTKEVKGPKFELEEIKNKLDKLYEQTNDEFYGLFEIKKDLIKIFTKMSDPNAGLFDIKIVIDKIEGEIKELSDKVEEINSKLNNN